MEHVQRLKQGLYHFGLVLVEESTDWGPASG